MRWSKQEKRQWEVGEQRVKRKFLFIPKCLPEGRHHGADKQWRWFEKAEILQELKSITYMPIPFIYPKNKWKNISWGNY